MPWKGLVEVVDVGREAPTDELVLCLFESTSKPP
jgi:hypothetical protein